MEVKQIIQGLQSMSFEDKEYFFQSKMCTNITATNLESMTQENIQKDIHSFNQILIRQDLFSKKPEIIKGKEEEEDILQISMFQKLNELQQKSNRMMSLFPGIGSRMLKGNSLINHYPEAIFGSNQDQITNKLKIIRNLQDKISQLQLNISNPNVCQEYIGSIQKEINLNFQNYYQEVKETNSQKADQTQLNASFDSKGSKEEVQKMPISTFSKKKIDTYDIVVCVPKFVEIEVPVPIIKPKQVYAEDCQSSEEWKKKFDSQKLKLNKNSRSKSENGDKKNSSGSSIQNIINQFTKKFNYEFNQKQILVYNKNEHEIIINSTKIPYQKQQSLSPEIDQKHQFHLPLDSFEKGCGLMNQEREYAVRRTDRSNISSYSQLQKIRDQFWNKDHLEFNQQYLSQVKQAQPKSPNQSFFDNHKDLGLDSRQDCKDDNQSQQQISALNEQIAQLKEQVSKKNIELGDFQQIKLQLQSRQMQKQAEMQYLNNKCQDLGVINENLKVELYKKEEELIKQQQLQKHFQERIRYLETQLYSSIEQRDLDHQQMMHIIKEKNEQIQDNTKIHLQLKNLLLAKDKEMENHISKTDSEITELKQEIQFYKRKLQEQGIHFNIEEASMIKELIEDKHNKQIIEDVLHEKYTVLAEQLKKEKINSQTCIEQLKKQNEKLSKLAFPSSTDDIILEQSIKTLIQNYNFQLGKREEEISHLRKTAEQAQLILKQTSYTCESEVNTINSIKNLLLSDSQKNEDQSLHFVYIVNRLIRHLKLYEYNLVREKEQRVRITKKLSELNLYIGKSIEKSQKRADKLQQENIRYKKQNQELSSQLRKLTTKFNSFKAKIASSEKQTNNIIQLQKELLQMQNKKLNQKCKKAKKYAEELQQKIIDQLVFLGNSPCEHFCSIITERQKNQKEELLESIQGSQISCFGEKLGSKVRNSKISLASSVISYSNKLSKNLPKAILAPLPPLPGTVTILPQSLTLDKLLAKRTWWTSQIKTRFILKLLDLCAELIKVNRKLFNLKPCQMLVSGLQGDIQIMIRREYSCVSQEQDEANLLYRAPEVLLGFTESQASYVWTVGVILDQIYHQKPFFKKLNDILSRKENYEVRDVNIPLKPLLENILRKKQKQRPSLSKIKEEIVMLNFNK